MSDVTHPLGVGSRAGDNPTLRQPLDDTRETNLNVFDKQSMTEALAAIRAMQLKDEPLSPIPAGTEIKDVFGKHDWENIDLGKEFGFTKTEDKLAIEKIPGDDGKTYSMELDSKDGRLTVWEVDAQGNKKNVEDPLIILEILQKAKYLEAIHDGKQFLDSLNLMPEQKGALDDVINGIKDKDPQAVKDAVDAYLKAGGDPSSLFHALGTLLMLRQVEGIIVGIHKVDGGDSIMIGFGKGSDKPDVIIDLPKQIKA